MSKKNLLEFIRHVEKHLNYDRDYETERQDIHNNREEMFKKYPKCFLNVRKIDGSEVPFFCICNKNGIIDKNIIQFYLKLADKIEEFFEGEELDVEHIEMVKKKLIWLLQRYSKDIPKDPKIAYRKGRITKFINSLPRRNQSF